MAAVDDFADQLQALGFEVTINVSKVTLPFEIPVGGQSGRTVMLGIDVPGDFPANPPTGPHVSPKLGHPDGAVSDSPQFGVEWEYWSRPFQSWASTNRTVSDYMAHVRRLFSQL